MSAPPVVKKGDEPAAPTSAASSSSSKPRPLLLDFSECDWTPDSDAVMFELTPAAKSAPSSLITDPLLCQLHGFIVQVEAQLRMSMLVRQRMRRPPFKAATDDDSTEKKKTKKTPPPIEAGPMLDWRSAAVQALTKESTDTEVVRLLQYGVYPVVRTLFWLQRNSHCNTSVHLMRDIVGSRRWRRAFCYVLQELMRMPPIPTQAQHEALGEWVNAQWTHDEETLLVDAGFGPFTPPSTPSMQTPDGDLILRLVREMTKTPDLSADQVAMVAALFVPSAAHRRRVGFIMHAQFVIARLISNRLLPPTAMSTLSSHTAIDWLREFVAHGCRCTS